MTLNPSSFCHPWDLSPREAIVLQLRLSGRIIRKSTVNIQDVATIAGVDVHFYDNLSVAAVVTIRLTDLETVEYATAAERIRYPYIPGLLAFREGPVVLEAMRKLSLPPDLLIFDGQGIAHPRRCGLASHMGLLLDRPAIGCAKKLLSGCYQKPGTVKGSYSFLTEGRETIGAALRTRSEIKPLFVSIGHRMNLQDCIDIVLKCCPRYRLPEALRRADQLARKTLKQI
jgi:deoxyribonuclease V